jgi:hypothetical protein
MGRWIQGGELLSALPELEMKMGPGGGTTGPHPRDLLTGFHSLTR